MTEPTHQERAVTIAQEVLQHRDRMRKIVASCARSPHPFSRSGQELKSLEAKMIDAVVDLAEAVVSAQLES